MEKFVHESVRLSCDLNRAMRMFLIQSLAEKWLGDVKIENKIGGTFQFKMIIDQNEIEIEDAEILEKKIERFIKIRVKVPKQFENFFLEENSIIEINFMQGTSRTEFCTEIHLLQKGFKDEESDKIRYDFGMYWANKLELLRQEINGDWVIEDRDLNRSYLMGGRL